ncbi:52 kDa repressor of the inhibitor of the kinase-like, partial [Paramuricea clavata]
NDKEEPMNPSSSSTNETTDNNSIKSSNFEINNYINRKSKLNNARRELIEKNRMRLSTIIGAILTCDRQSITLRGHRDDSQYYIEDDTTNPGNFIEIVKYGARSGNIMDEMFKDCPSNQTYRSKTIQNKIIEICGAMLSEALVTEIREEFLGFIPCQKGLSGEALSEEISNFIKGIDLGMEDCRGQGYDGAGNMAGKLSGVAARIQRIYDKAIYVHCNSHVLNLCVASSCKINVVRDMMDNVRNVSNFLNDSPKRTLVLKKKISEIVPTERRQKLLNVCRTRWVARIDGLRIFKNCYVALLSALGAIKLDKSNDPDVRYRAGGMKKAIEKVLQKAVIIPFLDQLMGQIQSRFSEGNLDALDVMYGMPNKVVSDPDWKENFSRFLNKYKDDQPDLDFLECELRCERSISTLRRLKTFMRSTMGEKRLKALALLNVHREIKLDVEKVIDRFALKHPRRMLLVDLLNSNDATLEESKDDSP